MSQNSELLKNQIVTFMHNQIEGYSAKPLVRALQKCQCQERKKSKKQRNCFVLKEITSTGLTTG